MSGWLYAKAQTSPKWNTVYEWYINGYDALGLIACLVAVGLVLIGMGLVELVSRMSLADIFQWVGCILVMIGYLGYGNKSLWGPALTIVACACLIVWGLMLPDKAEGIVVLNASILVLNVWNMIKWGKELA